MVKIVSKKREEDEYNIDSQENNGADTTENVKEDENNSLEPPLLQSNKIRETLFLITTTKIGNNEDSQNNPSHRC